MLIEIAGITMLVDPVWSERASPVGFAGPRRFHPPPAPLAELPEPDVVLLTHDHFDHLDEPTIRLLARGASRFILPLGLGTPLERWGARHEMIMELDWWEERTIPGTDCRLVALPARHYSGRSLFRRSRSLWASWAIVTPDHRVFMGCDSGPSSYATAFKTPLFKTNTFSEDGAFSSRDLLLPKNVVTWRGEVLSLGDVLSQRLVFFKKLPAQGGFRFMDNTLAQLQHGADIMFRRTADCLGWRDGPPPDETPCPDALAWPYWPGRVAQCLDLAHLAGLPVRKVTL